MEMETTNPSSNNNLDLNSSSDTVEVPMADKQDEISRVSIISVSSVETETTRVEEGGGNQVRVSVTAETETPQVVEGRGGNEVRVFSSGDDEKLVEGSEGDLKAVDGDESEKSSGGFDSDEQKKVGDDVIMVESVTVTETVIEEEETQVVVLQGESVEVPKEEVMSTVDDGLRVSPKEENPSMEASAAEGDGTLKEEAVVSSLGTNNTTTEQGLGAEMVSGDMVDGDEKTDLHLGEQNKSNGDHQVTVVAEDIDGAVGLLPDEEGVQETEVDSQIMESNAYEVNVSQLMDTKPNFGNLVVDFGVYPNTGGDKGLKMLSDRHSGKVEVEEIGSEYSVSDLVWGKVSSHPWWPGQIFDPLDASKLAKKHHKRDRKRLLVAYFGDQTFAWNVASSLRPFQSQFSHMVKQTDLEPFRFAVDSALDEISRRVQLGLACSCTPREAYAKIKYQIIKNAGIHTEASRREGGVDKNSSVTAFEPGKLLKDIKALALNPHTSVDRLELVVAKAQLTAFYCSKGYLQMPEFFVYGGLLEKEAELPTPIPKNDDQGLLEKEAEVPTSILKNEDQVYTVKRKLKSLDKLSEKSQETEDDNLNPIIRERNLYEVMGDEHESSKSPPRHSGKKRKSVGSFSDELTGKTRKPKPSQSSQKDIKSQSPRAFKIGESIRRIASQLKGSSPIINTSTAGARVRNPALKTAIPKEYSSPDEMLSQLHLAARDPMKGYSFLTIIVGFFTDFRNSISLDHSGSVKKEPQMKTGGRSRKRADSDSVETSSDEDRSDPCWTDRTIHISPEEKSSRKNKKRKVICKRQTPMKKDAKTVELEKDIQLDSMEVSEESNPSSGPDNTSQLNSTVDSEQQHPANSTVDSKQQDPAGDTDLVVQEPVSSLNNNGTEDISRTALILNFTEADSIPSEMELNKIFSRFGPLKESETEVIKKTSRARVVFKRRADADVAFSSAGKFSIFGPALASYQLKYLPSTPSKASSHPTTE